MNIEEMIAKFQCPGCVDGPDPSVCPSYSMNDYGGCGACDGHKAGTMALGAGAFFLGMPRGFNKAMGDPGIRLYTADSPKPVWDALNLPVWYLEEDGFLFVKTYLPRRNYTYLDVIEGATGNDITFNDISISDVQLPDISEFKPINMAGIDID